MARKDWQQQQQQQEQGSLQSSAVSASPQRMPKGLTDMLAREVLCEREQLKVFEKALSLKFEKALGIPCNSCSNLARNATLKTKKEASSPTVLSPTSFHQGNTRAMHHHAGR